MSHNSHHSTVRLHRRLQDMPQLTSRDRTHRHFALFMYGFVHLTPEQEAERIKNIEEHKAYVLRQVAASFNGGVQNGSGNRAMIVGQLYFKGLHPRNAWAWVKRLRGVRWVR